MFVELAVRTEDNAGKCAKIQIKQTQTTGLTEQIVNMK